MAATVKLEPTLILGGIVAALNVIQTAAIPGLPAWAHAVIALVSIGLGAIVNRSQVTPTAAVAAAAPSTATAEPEGWGPEQ